MKQFFENLNKQPPKDRSEYAASNVNMFVDQLINNNNSEMYLNHINNFIQQFKPNSNTQEFLEKIDNINLNNPDKKRAYLKVALYSHIIEDKKLQQDFAAHQVLNFCKRDSATTPKYDSEETQRLGENIAQILSPLAKDDKKTSKAIKDTSSITAREAISIISEVDHNVQLNKWQKFLHNTIDRLKGIFVNDKIHDVVKGDSFKRITEKLDDGRREILPLPITTTKTNTDKDKKQNTSVGR